MKMAILNLSKASQVTKTGIEGIQNKRNLVTVHRLMPTPSWKKNMEIWKVRQQMPSTGQIYEKMPLHGNLALYRNNRQMHRGGA